MKSSYRAMCLSSALTAVLSCSEQTMAGDYPQNDLGPSKPPDLTVSADLAVPVDLADPADLFQPPDLVPLPPPSLTSITPSTVSNAGGTLITLAGMNFQSGATVTVDGVPCANVNVVSPAQIQCNSPAQAGICRLVSVVVKNADGQQVTDATKLRYLADAPHFALPTMFGAGTAPGRLVLADMNSDGFLDVVATNPSTSNVAILTNNGLGSFNAVRTVAAGSGALPSAVAVADVDGDKLLDIVTANPGTDSVSFIKSLGTMPLSFAAPQRSVAIVGYGLRHLTVADVTGDNKPDAVFTYGSIPGAGLLPGDGSGAFKAPPDQYLTGTASEFVALADVNGDKKPDMLVAASGSNGFALWLGGAAPPFTFANMAFFAMGTGTNGLAVADFNNDQKLDVVTTNGGSNNVSVRLGDGAGKFGSVTNFAVGTGPSAVDVSDFDGDGNLDLAVANGGASSVSVLLGKGDGTFKAAVDVATGAGPQSIAFVNVNGDAFPDIVTNAPASNAVFVLYGQCK